MQPTYVNFESGQKYFWCTCGLSANQPFCDGSHKGTGQKSMCIEAEQTQTVLLCNCKQTQTPPYCDGSHNKEAAPQTP
ncbi:MAG: CDGSH iron-sulfur domain-containing protein [Alphaproteobacteria bacterium]